MTIRKTHVTFHYENGTTYTARNVFIEYKHISYAANSFETFTYQKYDLFKTIQTIPLVDVLAIEIVEGNFVQFIKRPSKKVSIDFTIKQIKKEVSKTKKKKPAKALALVLENQMPQHLNSEKTGKSALKRKTVKEKAKELFDYKYSGVDSRGIYCSGELHAESLPDARHRLQGENIINVKVRKIY